MTYPIPEPDRHLVDTGRPGGPNPTPVWLLGAITALLAVIVALLAIMMVARNDGADIEAGTPTTDPAAPTMPSPSTSGATTSTDPSATTTTNTEPTTSTDSTTGSTTGSTTTTASSTTDGSTATSGHVVIPAVWPWADSSTRYTDPVEAATAFATIFVGFDDPVAGPFLRGDSMSGEVEIRPEADGPATTILVRRLGPGNTWWVIGAVTDHIEIDEPEALDRVRSPLRVSGRANAFEGTIEIEVRADGSHDPIAHGFVTGGGTEMEPFDGLFTWDELDASAGSLLAISHNPEDGRVWQVAVIRIEFES